MTSLQFSVTLNVALALALLASIFWPSPSLSEQVKDLRDLNANTWTELQKVHQYSTK